MVRGRRSARWSSHLVAYARSVTLPAAGLTHTPRSIPSWFVPSEVGPVCVTADSQWHCRRVTPRSRRPFRAPQRRRPRRRKRRLTWAFMLERVTGIEPAFSAWEFDLARFADLGRWPNEQVRGIFLVQGRPASTTRFEPVVARMWHGDGLTSSQLAAEFGCRRLPTSRAPTLFDAASAGMGPRKRGASTDAAPTAGLRRSHSLPSGCRDRESP